MAADPHSGGTRRRVGVGAPPPCAPSLRTPARGQPVCVDRPLPGAVRRSTFHSPQRPLPKRTAAREATSGSKVTKCRAPRAVGAKRVPLPSVGQLVHTRVLGRVARLDASTVRLGLATLPRFRVRRLRWPSDGRGTRRSPPPGVRAGGAGAKPLRFSLSVKLPPAAGEPEDGAPGAARKGGSRAVRRVSGALDQIRALFGSAAPVLSVLSR